MSNLHDDQDNNEIMTQLTAKDGEKYQAKYANDTHAESIVDLFKNIYGWKYLYPFVYSAQKVRERINHPDQIWCIVTPLESNEVIGLSVIQKDEITLYVSKVNIKRNYQGIGIGRGLGANAFTALIGNPEFRNIRRLDSDVRAYNLNSQKFIEKTGSKPYGFIPNYNNYGDKRQHKLEKSKPFTNGKIEPVIMYASRFNSFWRIRNNNIVLYDDDDILLHYNIAKNNNRKMRRDNLTLAREKDLDVERIKIDEDFFKACVKFEGYIHEKTLNELLSRYRNWNVIEWRIPVNEKGIYSQRTALENEFTVVGYDPGSILLEELVDTILFCKFPNGVDHSQFHQMDLTSRNQKIAESVIKAL
jgi:RimJ/RimL family protein N-acetyltransferase